MAQDPSRPRDNGRIRLPATDAALNKIAPSTLKVDGKGDMLGAPPKKARDNEKIRARAMKRLDRAIGAEAENRKAALDDLKMKAGDQWPSEVAAQRNLDKRPCLTVNKLPTFVHQITNDLRQNRPSININPVGDRGDREVAKMYRGLIRYVERESAADIAYDTAVDNAVSNGFGYWRILTEYEAPDSFNLVPVIRRIRNPFTVYLDPSHIEPDGSDSRWGFITEMMPRSDFEEKYPDCDPMPFTAAGIGEAMKNWINADEIRIAEYFEIEYKSRTLVSLSTGHEGWRDDLSGEVESAIADGSIEVLDERESSVPTVHWYKLTAKDIIQDREWPGKWVPIVKVIGDEIDIEGRVKLSGVIRHAKDPQRMFNYWRTKETEAIALAPNAPWIVEEGQIEGHEDEWKQANIRNNPYLSYKATSVAGGMAPPPQRQNFAQVPAGIEVAIQGAAQDMIATTGIRFDATMNERLMDESGKAIRELRRNGDLGSFHYVDNFARSLRHTGQMLMDLFPKLLTSARVMTILREDDSEEQVRVDPNLGKPTGEMRRPDGKTMKVFNPTAGRYGVTVTIGPSYATKRIEASENMIAFARALPETAHFIADLIAKNQDWPGADEIAARLAKTLPPALLAPDQKDMSPQVQAMLAAMDGQIKQLTQQLQAAMMALNDKNADRALEADKANKDFEAKLLKVVADLEAKQAATEERAVANFNTHIGAQIRELGMQVAGLVQSMEKGARDGAAATGA